MGDDEFWNKCTFLGSPITSYYLEGESDGCGSAAPAEANGWGLYTDDECSGSGQVGGGCGTPENQQCTDISGTPANHMGCAVGINYVPV
jgi:hypothetical protein